MTVESFDLGCYAGLLAASSHEDLVTHCWLLSRLVGVRDRMVKSAYR